MKANRWLLLGALGVALGVVACSNGEIGKPPDNPPVTVDAGTDAGQPLPDAGPGSQCLNEGTACSRDSGAQCCTGLCSDTGVCPAPSAQCTAAGAACTSGIECCTNSCLDGTCSTLQCLDVGSTCASAEACCTKLCGADGKCAALPSSGTSSCKVPGQACTGAGDCCSSNCQGGVCKAAYSCQANDDLCMKGADCCGGVCSQENTGTPGRCVAVSGGGAGGCLQDGNPCSGSSNCCSRTCVDLGYGTTVCQPVGGCRPTGDYCTDDGVCCGGEKVSNAVDCRESRCDKPNGCNPVGNICGSGQLPDGGIIDVNAREACCDGQKAVCKVDSAGVPRCFGGCPNNNCPAGCPTGYTGEEPCCIAQEQQCQFSDQCCGGARCLPGADGGLTCQKVTCDPVGTTCDPQNSKCCAGTTCSIVSEFAYACRAGAVPGGGTDGGTGTQDGGTDAGTCAANGKACGSGAACCSGICTNGTCAAPSACQPQGQACTSPADCCVGLGCTIPGGSIVGTCETGSTCSAAGQACSPTSPCCPRLSCETVTGEACTGTTPCTCNSPIG
ncbi:hypothetical protein [Corallococcus sp. 4LFB]|uniref:hypothetical protein n=1 Tax=Corallococcus sp. 4LFB TaxID=3383249 RepID=UPI003974E798